MDGSDWLLASQGEMSLRLVRKTSEVRSVWSTRVASLIKNIWVASDWSSFHFWAQTHPENDEEAPLELLSCDPSVLGALDLSVTGRVLQWQVGIGSRGGKGVTITSDALSGDLWICSNCPLPTRLLEVIDEFFR